MKLDELEIGDARPGAVRQRDAVAGRDRRIGRLAEHLPGAAGREQHAPARARRRSAPSSLQKPRADAAAVLDDEADDPRVIACVVTRGSCDARSQSTRPISRPVASRACSTRRTLCAAFAPSAGSPSASRSNAAPHSISSRT